MALISGAAGRLISGKRDARNTKKEHEYSVESRQKTPHSMSRKRRD